MIYPSESDHAQSRYRLLPRDRKWCFTRLFLIFYEGRFLGMSSSIERYFGFRCAVERMTLPLRMALPLMTKSLGSYLAATCIYSYSWQCTWQRGLELLLSTALGTRFARFSYEFSGLSVIVQRFMMQAIAIIQPMFTEGFGCAKFRAMRGGNSLMHSMFFESSGRNPCAEAG